MIVLTGDNVFELHAARTKLRDEFVAKHGEYGFQKIQAPDAGIAAVRAALTSVPFLASAAMVVLEEPGQLTGFSDVLAELSEQIPDETTVVLVESKLDKRGKYYKWLKANTDFREFKMLDERGLASWAVAYVKAKGALLSTADATYLVQRVGLDQLRLGHELDKLVLVGPKITRVEIDSMTEPLPQSKIFDLLDAAFAGQQERALALYHEQRALRVEPQEILAMMGWQLRHIALAKTAQGHDLVREGKLSPYGAQKAQRVASRLTLAELKRLVADLTNLDIRSKSVALDLDSALTVYILSLNTRLQS